MHELHLLASRSYKNSIKKSNKSLILYIENICIITNLTINTIFKEKKCHLKLKIIAKTKNRQSNLNEEKYNFFS